MDQRERCNLKVDMGGCKIEARQNNHADLAGLVLLVSRKDPLCQQIEDQTPEQYLLPNSGEYRLKNQGCRDGAG